MRTGADTSPAGRRVLLVVVWLGGLALAGWLAWCATFQFTGIATEAEIVSTRTEQHRTRKGRRHADTYGIVRYADQTGLPRSTELRLHGDATVGRKIPVRYLPARPEECRHDDFWGIWGLAVMVSGAFALIVGLTWYVERKNRPADPRHNPFAQTPS
jgi:hypothetical protein